MIHPILLWIIIVGEGGGGCLRLIYNIYTCMVTVSIKINTKGNNMYIVNERYSITSRIAAVPVTNKG